MVYQILTQIYTARSWHSDVTLSGWMAGSRGLTDHQIPKDPVKAVEGMMGKCGEIPPLACSGTILILCFVLLFQEYAAAQTNVGTVDCLQHPHQLGDQNEATSYGGNPIIHGGTRRPCRDLQREIRSHNHKPLLVTVPGNQLPAT